MREPRPTLPLSEYKALRDSLRQPPTVLHHVAVPDALKAYLTHARSANDVPKTRPTRVREAGH